MQIRPASTFPLGNGPFDTIGNVILDPGAPLAVSRLLEFLAATARAAEVDLKDGIAAAGEELHVRVEAPIVVRAKRPAMRHDDHREWARLARGAGQESEQGLAVPILELEGKGGGHCIGLINPWFRTKVPACWSRGRKGKYDPGWRSLCT